MKLFYVIDRYEGSVYNLPKFFFVNELKKVAMKKDEVKKSTGTFCSLPTCLELAVKFCNQGCHFLCQSCYDEHCVSRFTQSVSVYYVAVRTIVLSHHGNNLERPVIMHDISHSLTCMPSTPHCGFSEVSPDGNCAYVHSGSFTSNSSQSNEPSDLRGSLSPTTRHRCTMS